MRKILDSALCPRCRGPLGTDTADTFDCAACGQTYPRLSSIRVLLPEAARRVEIWRQQLGLVLQHASESIRALAVQASAPDLAATTRARLQALARSIAEQAAEMAQIVRPALGDPLVPEDGVELPRGATDYMSCLFRDWAWSGGHDPENEQSLAAIRRITAGRDLGRTLVLGAGGCRLAYDLHLQGEEKETTVVDLDPFLLVFAEAIIPRRHRKARKHFFGAHWLRSFQMCDGFVDGLEQLSGALDLRLQELAVGEQGADEVEIGLFDDLLDLP